MNHEVRKVYIAKALVLSELASVVQSIVNVNGGELFYTNLVVFVLLCCPLLLAIKIKISEIILILLFFILIAAKALIQGVGEFYFKAMILLLMLPIYAALARRTSVEHIARECYCFRHLIWCSGLIYLVSWSLLSTYRNASTVATFLMLILASRNLFYVALSTPFALVMKTQYKIWSLVAVAGLIMKANWLRRWGLFLLGIGAIFIPLILMKQDLSWTGFNLSELASLEERFKEVSGFLKVFSSNAFYWIAGWPVGQLIASDGLSDRGYMHSGYLWIIGTLGVPFALFFLSLMFTKKARTRKLFFIRAFLILSNAFTFLLITNPLCTILMLANEKNEAK